MQLASSASRFALGAPLALGAAVGLAMLMQTLIAVRDMVVEEPAPAPLVDFLFDSVETPPDPRRPPITVLVDPPPVVTTTLDGGDDAALPPLPTDPGLGPVEPPSPTRTFLAQSARRIFTPTPVYPANAGDREGSCRVTFDVDAAGRVRNANAASCTSSVFARAAEQTVLRSVYHPAMGEAGPIATTGLSLEIVFQLTD